MSCSQYNKDTILKAIYNLCLLHGFDCRVVFNIISEFFNFVYLKLLFFHFRLSWAASFSSLRPGPEMVVSKRGLLEREALLLLVTHAVVVHCLQRVEVHSYGLAGKEAGVFKFLHNELNGTSVRHIARKFLVEYRHVRRQ